MSEYVLLDTPVGGVTTADVRWRDIVASWMRPTSLDRRLAHGVPPESDRVLAVRAVRISSVAARARLARNLMSLLRRADDPLSGARIPLARSGIDEARAGLIELARILNSPNPVPAHAVASTRLLLTDPASSVWAGARRDVLGDVERIFGDLHRPGVSLR